MKINNKQALFIAFFITGIEVLSMLGHAKAMPELTSPFFLGSVIGILTRDLVLSFFVARPILNRLAK